MLGVEERKPPNGKVKDKKSCKANTYKWLYQWHRIIGVAVLVPIIMWTISGLMHPMMSHWFKVEVPHRALLSDPLSSHDFRLSIKDVLSLNRIEEFENFRIVAFEGNTYYQVHLGDDEGTLQYFNTENGILERGVDEKYASYLARYFMGMQRAEVASVDYLKDFTEEYKVINRLLPVYRVTLGKGGIDVFVHTGSGRLGTVNDNMRKILLTAFGYLHNWSFLGFNKYFQIATLTLVAGIVFLSSLSGIVIYALMWKRFRKQRKNGKPMPRKYHRQLGIATSLVMLLFSLSGAYHAFHKASVVDKGSAGKTGLLHRAEMGVDPIQLLKNTDSPVANISVVRIGEGVYYQFLIGKGVKRKMLYISAETEKPLENGDLIYAKHLAARFSSLPAGRIVETVPINKFEGEYGFINKRLPVVKVAYSTSLKDTYYVETSTGKLAAFVTNPDRWEGFSFAFLHKYHLLDFAGKGFRDVVMALAAMGVLVVSVLGMILLLKK